MGKNLLIQNFGRLFTQGDYKILVVYYYIIDLTFLTDSNKRRLEVLPILCCMFACA